jgi:hypothetical protein
MRKEKVSFERGMYMIRITQLDYNRINNVLSQVYDEDRGGIFDNEEGVITLAYSYLDYVGEITSGSSKLVYFPPDTNYVVKIPITGIIEENYYSESDTIEVEEVVYDGFRTSSSCEDEMFLYKEAKVLGISDFFPEIVEIETILNEKVYAQEKVEAFLSSDFTKTESVLQKTVDSKAKSSQSQDIRTAEKQWFEDNYLGYLGQVAEQEIIFRLIEQYGIDKVKKLNTFCKLHDINDIKYYNVGVNSKGKIVIFDYSGWGN